MLSFHMRPTIAEVKPFMADPYPANIPAGFSEYVKINNNMAYYLLSWNNFLINHTYLNNLL